MVVVMRSTLAPRVPCHAANAVNGFAVLRFASALRVTTPRLHGDRKASGRGASDLPRFARFDPPAGGIEQGAGKEGAARAEILPVESLRVLSRGGGAGKSAQRTRSPQSGELTPLQILAQCPFYPSANHQKEVIGFKWTDAPILIDNDSNENAP